MCFILSLRRSFLMELSQWIRFAGGFDVARYFKHWQWTRNSRDVWSKRWNAAATENDGSFQSDRSRVAAEASRRLKFDQAFQSLNPPAAFKQQGADAIFAALDPSGTGSVSKQDFITGMSNLMASLRADNSASLQGPSPTDSLSSSLQFLNSLDPSSIPANSPPGAFLNTTA